MQIIYAVFSNRRAARRAQRWLRDQLGDRAEASVLERPERLSHHVIPLSLTEARSGAFVGALLLGLTTALALAVGLWARSFAGGEAVPALGATELLSVALAALFGALAGALAFSSNSSTLVGHLREHLRRHEPVVLVRGPVELEAELRQRGALEVGALA